MILSIIFFSVSLLIILGVIIKNVRGKALVSTLILFAILVIALSFAFWQSTHYCFNKSGTWWDCLLEKQQEGGYR